MYKFARLPDFPNFTKDLDNWLWEKHKAVYALLQSKKIPISIKFELYAAMGTDFIMQGKGLVKGEQDK